MKVIFVASGNKAVGTVSAFVRSQYESLQREGVDMVLFPITGHGWKAYAHAISQLRKVIRRECPDVVHAHYSVCGVVAAAAACGTKAKVMVSILGSFPDKTFKLRWVRFFIKNIWNATLVKSQRTADQLGMTLPVVPNGVNLEQFALLDYKEARTRCGFDEEGKYVIWCSNPSRPEKNYPLAQRAVELLDNPAVRLVPVFDKPHDKVVEYMCAADVLLLTSQKEGSPNVIKEALACNCPLVSTDVGDVRHNIQGVEGAYVADDSVEGLTECLRKALAFGRRTEGRRHLIEIGLTSGDIARRIIELYAQLTTQK